MTGKTDSGPFVKRVRIKNYKSIAACDVRLGPLTVLLGFNASGKSNFLDALRFVQDALRTSPREAVSARGGFDSVLRRSDEPVRSFGIWLDLELPTHGEGRQKAFYGFEIGTDSKKRVEVVREECTAGTDTDFEAEFGDLVGTDVVKGHSPGGRLMLPVVSLLGRNERFARLKAALTATRFYEFDAAAIRALDEETTRQDCLGPAGEHIGHILGNLASHNPVGKQRLDAYLSAIVPNALSVDERPEGRYSTIEARFRVDETSDQQTVFPRESLSEGTLRAAAVLAALFQEPVSTGDISLIGIEEPETALHPATVGALYEALTEASMRVQVIVTSQSSDLLDNDEAKLSHVRAVASVGGITYIGEVDKAGQQLVADKITSVAGLHRSGQMLPQQVGYPVEDRPLT
jgi:predicted ATPase